MKRTLLIAVPVILVLLGVLLVAPGFVDWNQYKGQAQDQIKTATGQTAELRGDISLSLLPTPYVSINDVQVAAPQGSTNPVLARFGRLDVHLALLPLLTGKVDIASVTLVEPQVALEVFKDGTQNWMTPELQKLTAKDPNAPAQQSATPPISVQNISIEKGQFTYLDRSKNDAAAPVTLADINVDASMDSLKGPFDVDGSFSTGGRTIEISAKTGAMDASGALKVNADGKVKPSNLAFSYAGIVATTAPYQAQGETTLSIDSLKDLTGNKDLPLDDDSLKLKGLLTASQDAVALKNSTFTVAGNDFSGDLSAALKPLKITGEFTASDTVSIDKFIKPSGKGGNMNGQMLPETLTLPMPFEAGIKLSAPSMVYNKQIYKDTQVMFSKKDTIFAVDFSAGSIPGAGHADVTAAVKFASKSASQKDGTEVYSDPTLLVTVKGDSQNMAQTAQAVTGKPVPALEMWKSGAIVASASATPDLMTLKDTTLRLGDNNFTVNGSYKAGARPKLVADVATDTIDIDALQAKMGKSGSGGGKVEDTLRGLALPFDMDFDFGAQSVRYQGKDIKGLRAQGSFKENALTFSNLSAQDFAGAAFKAQGGISDLKNLSGIDVTVSGQAGDAKELAKMAGADISKLPQSLQNAALSVAAKGTLDKLAVNVDVKALNGDLIAKGDVDQPMGKMAISNMAIQVKHPNLADALQAFSPGSARYVSLEKPLDFYADVDRSGNVYSLKNMKANVAGSPVTGSFTIDTGAAKPTVKADLTFQDLTIQTSAAAAGVPKQGQRWSSDPIDTAWMNSAEADISVKANSIVYQNWNLQKPVLDVALHGGKLNVSQLNAGLFGGQMKVTASASAGSGNKGFSAVESSASFQSVSLEETVKALVGTKLIKATGDVNLSTRITTAGASQAALVNALTGNGTTNGQKIVLEGFDLARFAQTLRAGGKPKDTLGGLWQSTASGGSTAFDTMDGAFEIQNGVINITKLNMDGAQSSLTTTGNVNLPQWTIATTHTFTIKPQAGETEAIPPFTVKVAGSLDSPAQTLGQGVLQNYLNQKIGGAIVDKVGKDSGIGKVLGGVLGLPQEQAPAATTTAPQQVEPAAQSGEPTAEQVLNPQTQDQPQQLTPEEQKAADKKSKKDAKQQAIQGLLKGVLGQ